MRKHKIALLIILIINTLAFIGLLISIILFKDSTTNKDAWYFAIFGVGILETALLISWVIFNNKKYGENLNAKNKLLAEIEKLKTENKNLRMLEIPVEGLEEFINKVDYNAKLLEQLELALPHVIAANNLIENFFGLMEKLKTQIEETQNNKKITTNQKVKPTPIGGGQTYKKQEIIRDKGKKNKETKIDIDKQRKNLEQQKKLYEKELRKETAKFQEIADKSLSEEFDNKIQKSEVENQRVEKPILADVDKRIKKYHIPNDDFNDEDEIGIDFDNDE
ncbi:hypothetical protein ACW95P_01835 [Candidatus Mycoplasma pogonae]